MTSRGGTAHIGSIFSVADMLAVLYGRVLRVAPAGPSHPDRDRFILSKGHAGAGVYAALAELGFFPVELLREHCPERRRAQRSRVHKGMPGVELSTGLARSRARRRYRHGPSSAPCRARKPGVSSCMSDGECDEGSNWEAILFAGHHRLAST